LHDTSGFPKPNRQPNNSRSGKTRRGTGANKPVSVVSYDSVSKDVIHAAITTITDNGCAILLSRTADGGAYSITMLDGDERVRDWPHDAEGCEKSLKWMASMFDIG
jgi:hypothetical protein